jgi:MFS transporter, NRE family, putaive nickel resistance protein
MSNSDNPTSLWRHRPFQQLFWAHALSLLGSGLTSVALGLLAHQLVGASASSVLGTTLAIRILVIVLCSPWAGKVGDVLGPRKTMIASDLMRAAVVVGFFFANSVWQIYVLAVFLNFGSAIFTPIYRAVIPGVVTTEQYPRALAIGSVAYDTANILGPSLAAGMIALFGFRGNFIADAITFLGSAALLIGLPRLAMEAAKSTVSAFSTRDGMAAMIKRLPLRRSIYLALQTSVGGAFVIVATIDFIKNELALTDQAYAWAMGAFGIGSVLGAVIYGKVESGRGPLVFASAPGMIAALACVAAFPAYATVVAAWFLIGAAYSILGIRSSEFLAANSTAEERSHIYAAHFALSHAGWGLTYPLAGFLTTGLGFATTAWIFAAILAAVSLPFWLARRDA